MNKTRKATVSVKGTAITVMVHREEDYISLIDAGDDLKYLSYEVRGN